MDRVIQQAIHQVLSPIWEAHFSDFSYGFRPKRSAHDALHQATEYINQGHHWIIDLDLKSFDRVHHDKLMGLISRRVGDKTLLRLIRRYLQSGYGNGAIFHFWNIISKSNSENPRRKRPTRKGKLLCEPPYTRSVLPVPYTMV